MFKKTICYLSYLIMLCFFQGCNPLWSSNEVDSNLGLKQSANSNNQPQSAIWNFSNLSDYTFDPNYISITAGKATLLQVDQTHNSANDFSSGTHLGTTYTAGVLTNGNAGGCDGAATNCSELNATWTPKYANIVGYWKMNNNWNDSGPNNIIATPEGGPVFSTDAKLGSHAGSFDLIDDYISLGEPTALNFNPSTDDFSVSIWVKFNNTTSGTILSKTQPGVSQFRLANFSSGLRAEIGGTAIVAPRISETGTWNHIGFTNYDDAGTQRANLYLNGVEVASGTSGLITAPGIDWLIGARRGTDNTDSGSLFRGDLDELAIWNTKLEPNDFSLIYKRQRPNHLGIYTSPIINLGTSGAWTSINWVTSLPFGKGLPGSSGNELTTDYTSLVDLNGANGTSTLSDSLVALWHLENSGLDSSGESNTLTLESGTYTTEAILGHSAVHFNGLSDRMSYSNNFEFNSDDFSISSWIYLNGPGGGLDGNHYIFSQRVDSTGNGSPTVNLLVNNIGKTSFQIRDNISGTHTITSLNTLNLRQWYHIVAVKKSTKTHIYVNGTEQGAGTHSLSGDFDVGSIYRFLGKHRFSGSNRSFLNGNLDEIGVWLRALHSSEILELYRRGANRVKYQVRSCDDPACAGESWIGPNGTDTTYFSESHNCDSINNANGECDGAVQTSLPSLIFSDYVSAPTNNQYFQYEVLLEFDDENILCDGSSCMPHVLSIELGPPNRYFGGSPTIINTTPIGFSSLSDFTETTGGACITTYQLSNDGMIFYYWTGSTWAIASGVAQSNNAIDINTNISSFTTVAGMGSLYWKVFLNSDTSQDCELDELNFSF